ncbi:MAG: signal peptidase I [bacterium]
MEQNIEKTTETEVVTQKESWLDILKFVITVLAIVIPIRVFVAQPFLVDGLSMHPTLTNHDYLIVDEISYYLGHIKRGDVVVFRYPEDPTKHFVKRMIGLPGETITIQAGIVTIKQVDGTELTLNEPYLTHHSTDNGTYTVPADNYFVLGDNRTNSADSRYWGFVPKKDLTGRALIRLYPFNKIGLFPGEERYQ